MASKPQSKAAAKTPAAPFVDPRGKAPEVDDEPQPRKKTRVEAVVEAVEEMVTVTVPKAFKLLTDAGLKEFPVGIYEMARSEAEHWYAKHHGVEIKD